MTSLGVDCVPTHNIPSVVAISGWMQVTRNIGVNPACLLYKLSSRYHRLYSSPFALREPERTGKNRTRRDSSGDDYYYLLFSFSFLLPTIDDVSQSHTNKLLYFIYLYIGTSMMHSSLRFWFRLKKRKEKRMGDVLLCSVRRSYPHATSRSRGLSEGGKKEKSATTSNHLSLFLCMYASLSL